MHRRMVVTKAKGKPQHICNACRTLKVTAYMLIQVACSPGQLLKGDCLNVTETRLGPVKACLAMPCVYMYLASFVMTCKTLQLQQKQKDEQYHALKASQADLPFPDMQPVLYT